jgi:bifunctional isochorismate lyase/aryl carrier protein
MNKPCLIVIDMIKDYLDTWEPAALRALVGNTNKLVENFKRRRLPVIWVRNEFRPDLSDAFLEMREKNARLAIQDTQGAQLHPDLLWSPSDITVVKKRYSAFFGTNLDELLAECGATELVLCGINTHACIRTAAIDAYQRDFRVFLAEECIDTYDDEHGRISLSYMNGKIARLATVDEILSLAPGARP